MEAIDPMRLESAVQRLRAEKEEADRRQAVIGEKDGSEWALNASYNALTAFEQEFGQGEVEGTDFSAHGICDAIGTDFPEFWEEVVSPGGEHDSDGYIRGFIRGVLEAWERVKSEL